MNKANSSTEYPANQVPVLPPYLRNDTILGLVPSNPVFPSVDVVRADIEYGDLHVDSSKVLTNEDREPTDFEGRIGLLLVNETLKGELFNGLIADFRYVEPGSIESFKLYADQEDTDDVKKLLDDDMRPLLAAVFLDPEGQLDRYGSEKLRGHLGSLMASVDGWIDPTAGSRTPAVLDASEKSSGYYLG